MKRKRFCSFLSFFLHVVLLVGCLPLGVLAFPGADEYRGSYMTEDDNGVMIYDDLEKYVATTHKSVLLSTNYKTQIANEPSVLEAVEDTRYPDLVADIAFYWDKNIVGTNPVVRYGLSEIDSVTYVDAATGETVKGKSPRELTGSNGGDPSRNGGYFTNEKGETTTHYDTKNLLFYIINHSCGPRIGTEDDISILTDYIEQGYLVAVVDFMDHENAISPYIELALSDARSKYAGKKLNDILDANGKPISTSIHYAYFLPEGYRLERDVWYYDPSIWSVNGVMEEYMKAWNNNVPGTTNDVNGTGELTSVEDMIARLKQRDGKTPIDYKYTMNIVYPSQPLNGQKVPTYVQEGTSTYKELNVQAGYTRCTLLGFALNGYAAVQYDHSFHPFLNRDQYSAAVTHGNYGVSYDLYNNARAAVRCARYLADDLGYSAENLGSAGISKATIGAAILSVKNNKSYNSAVPGYNVNVTAGDIFPEGTVSTAKTPEGRLKAIVQPFMTYKDGVTEISSETACSYIAGGGGTGLLFNTGSFNHYEKVPIATSEGLRDEYGCFGNFAPIKEAFEGVNEQPFFLIPMLDQNHTYPIGYDDEYGYDRFVALIKFFDVHLKPDENRAPEVAWMTPTDGSTAIPVSGKWTIGPYTPYGKPMNSYEHEQSIQVRFFDAVDPESVNRGMVVTSANGKRIDGKWISSQNDALFTFETDGLAAGTTYTITATSGILSKNGTPLAEKKSVTFTTEGTYALYAVADTYVSSAHPTKVFGDAKELLVEGGSTALLTYPAASIASATKITLSTYGLPDAGTSFTVYALPNYKVDEATLTHSKLMSEEAWWNRIPLGSFTAFDSKQLSLDLSALASKTDLGDYVTLALVSDHSTVRNPYVFEANFDFYQPGVAIGIPTESKTTSSATIVTHEGAVIDGKTLGETNIYSNYIACFGGGNPRAMHLVEEDGSMALRVEGISVTVKLYNTLKGSALTADDVGKCFRISFRAKPSEDGVISCNITNATSNSSAVTTVKHNVKGGEWQEFTMFVTLTEEMMVSQAGMLSINLPMYSWHNYSWIDDVTVTECTPRMTIAAKESDSSLRLAMITTNPSPVTFAEGDLEADDLSTEPIPVDPSEETKPADTTEVTAPEPEESTTDPEESSEETEPDEPAKETEPAEQPVKLTFWQKLWNWIKSLFSIFKKKS